MKGIIMKGVILGIAVIAVLLARSNLVRAEEPAANDAPKGMWLTNIEDAQKVAEKEGKDIIVDFCGSDWCVWCQRLEEEVFNTFVWKKSGLKKYVMVSLDFPRQKELPKEQKEYNDKIMKKYGITGFPTIVVLDAQGKPYARTGYQAGGPEKYLDHLTELAKQKTERDDLLAQAKKGTVEEQTQTLEKLVDQLNKWGVSFAYLELPEQIISLDKENKLGLKIKHATALALYYYSHDDKDKAGNCLKAVKECDAAKAGEVETRFKLIDIQKSYFEKQDWAGAIDALTELAKSKTPNDVSQEIWYDLACAQFQSGKHEAAIANLEKARLLAPDSPLGQQIQHIQEQLKHQQQEK